MPVAQTVFVNGTLMMIQGFVVVEEVGSAPNHVSLVMSLML